MELRPNIDIQNSGKGKKVQSKIPNTAQNDKRRVQAWGTPEDPNQTTERVFAMLQINQNIISKYNTIKEEQSKTLSLNKDDPHDHHRTLVCPLSDPNIEKQRF